MIRKIFPLTIPVLLTACSADSSPTNGAEEFARGTPLVWHEAPGNSKISVVGDDGHGQIVLRCWNSDDWPNCLYVGEQKMDDGGVTYHAFRRQLAKLPSDDLERSEMISDGYVCQIHTKLGIAVEAFSPGEAGKNENIVSLIGEEPIGSPLKTEQVEKRLHSYPEPKGLHFDCVELGGVLMAKGIGAVKGSLITEQLMR